MLHVPEARYTQTVDAQDASGLPLTHCGGMANDSPTPNCKVVWLSVPHSKLFRVPVLQTKRPIATGEELTISYSANGALPASVAY